MTAACWTSAIASAQTAAPAPPAPAPAATQSDSALPDLSGTWMIHPTGLLSVSANPDTPPTSRKNGLPAGVPKRDFPPYKPDWEAKYQQNLEHAKNQGDTTSKDTIIDTHTVYCVAGVPRNVMNLFDRRYIVTPKITWIIVGGEVREIYTDGRAWPSDDEMYERFQGWSIGHWENGVLNVETRHMKSALWADNTPLMFGENAVLKERYRLADPDTIEVELTIIDDESLTKPWTVTRKYHRVPIEWVDEKEICGGPEDHNPIVNGVVTTKTSQ